MPIDFSDFQDKRILITGGLGFVGSNLAQVLAGHCAELTLVDSLISQYGGNLFNISGIEDSVRVNLADVRDGNTMDYLVRGKDYIFNLAGQVSHVDSMLDPFADLENNCRSSLTLLECCRKHNRGAKVVFAGTHGQYGRVQQLPVTEAQPLHPEDINGVHKNAAETYHLLYHRNYGIRTCSLRITDSYGPRHHMRTSGHGLLNWFTRLALDGRKIPLQNAGAQERDFIYIEDVVEAFLIAAASGQSDGQIFNVGSGAATPVRHAAELIVETVGAGAIEEMPVAAEKPANGDFDYYADCSGIRRALGWEARTPLREGIARTVAFFREHRRRYWEEE